METKTVTAELGTAELGREVGPKPLTGHSVTMTGQGRCHCFLIGYAALATVAVIGLIILCVHQTGECSQLTTAVQDNSGGKIINLEEHSISFDFLNNDARGAKTTKESCPTMTESCPHYFSNMEVLEVVALFVLGFLLIWNWGKISLWITKKIQKRSKRQAAIAEGNAAKEKEEEKRKI